jgi:hypothetical protein
VSNVTPFLRATARTSEGREEEEEEEIARGELEPEVDGEEDLNVDEEDEDDEDEDDEDEEEKRTRLVDGLGALSGGIALKSEAEFGPPIAPAPELLCTAVAADADAASATGVPFPLFPSEETVVDSASSLGSIVLRTTTGTPANAAGKRHLGCNTFAPIAASS